MNLGGVLDEHFLLEQQGLHLTVFASRAELEDVLMEQVIAEAHAGADESRRQTQAVVGLAEDGVVDFLAGTVEHGYIVVGVLGAAVALDDVVAGVAENVQLFEEVGQYDVVGIEHHDVVEVAFNGLQAAFHLIDGVLHGLGLGTFLKCRCQ